MNSRYARSLLIMVTALVLAHGSAFAQAAAQTKPFEPQVGQPGKDVVWVPTPQQLVEKMLDMAKLTPQDFHMDLGSGDGRTVITAAKRGARSEGIEYNPDMVALSQKNAQAAGVAEKAIFRKADIFETDFSKANVITLFLLPMQLVIHAFDSFLMTLPLFLVGVGGMVWWWRGQPASPA